MKTKSLIQDKLLKIPLGEVFTYMDLLDDSSSKEAIIKALNRMASSGQLKKLSKGKFYKPEITVFGTLQPEQQQIVKDLLENDGRIIGYLTGLSVFRELGLTTQVSNLIQIGRNDFRPPLKRGKYTISFTLQKNIITKKNIPLLQILDAIRYIKKIPDTSLSVIIKRLLAILNDIPENELSTLIDLALKYPPSTRALLGVMLEEMGRGVWVAPLRKQLNPVTAYKLNSVNQVLSTASNWNIK